MAYVNEETYKKINEAIIRWKYYDDFEAYRKENGYEEEMYDYYRLSSDATKIPVDIWFDDCKSYIMNEHPLWLYFRNGYSREISEFIPISISNNPQVLVSNPKLRISSNDLLKIKQFIQRFKKELILVANDKLPNHKFALFVREVTNRLLESIIAEMAIIKRSESKLETDLWIDTGVAKQHGSRIKFKSSNDQKKSTEYSTMTISDNPEIIHMPKKTFLSSKDIEKIKKFIIYNKDKLLQLDKGEINFETEFLPYMIKVGDNGGPIYPTTLLEPLVNPTDIEHPENKDVNQMVLNYFNQVNNKNKKNKNTNNR